MNWKKLKKGVCGLEAKLYKIYGLNVKSEMPLPEAAEAENERIDVVINCGQIPKHAKKAIEEGKIGVYFRKEAWFLVKNIGQYYIANGNEIIVEGFEGAEPHRVKSFVLGASLGVLLLQRETIALHGSGVIVNDEAWVITGESGAGKSTLTTRILKEGVKFLADDTVALETGENIYALPGYPQQKLCRNAVVELGYEINRLKRIDEDREKYAVSLTERFYADKIKLGRICELTIYDGTEVQIEELQGHEKLQAFLNNMYCGITLKYSGMSPQFFTKCLQVVQTVPWYRIRRPRQGDTTKEQFRLLKEI